MLDPSPDLVADVPARRLSGATWAGLAFVAGTLVALLPMYYYYAGSTSGPREQPAPTPAPVEIPKPASADATDRFASRMTYELSQVPEEPAARPPAASAQATAAVAPEPAVVAFRREPEAVEERVGARVSNARPISSTPPDPRDTTREIENEARRAEFAQSPSRSSPRSEGARVVEGREIVGAVKGSIATRPIGTAGAARADDAQGPVATAVANPERKGAEAVTRTNAVVSGVSPIGAAPEPVERSEPGGKAVTGAGTTVPADMESRLAATRDWLSAAPQTMHTIQILGTNSEDQLKSQLRALAKVLEPQKIYVFRTFAQGKPAMTVVYGGYADRQAALQALEKLPASVSANRPVLRTVNGIRTELKQHGIKTES